MRRLAWALLLGAAAATAGAQSQPEETPLDPSELVNALLGGLMGATPVDGPTLQKEVEDVGGVPFKHDVPIAFLDRSQLAAYLRELFDAEYPEAQARADERLLVAFDLVPEGTDLRGLRARLLEQNVVGFYDDRPDRRRLYAVSTDRSLTPMNQIVLAHEMRHALQDQYADLHALLTGDQSDFDDRRLAVLSLYEGDATLVMERFLRARLGPLADLAGGGREEADLDAGALGTPGLFDVQGAPAVVRDQLVQPYLAGLGLARTLWRRGGASALREAWSHPPDSTEQVLHPELYLARQAPRAVTPTVGPPAGARLVGSGVLGEMLLRTLLGEGQQNATSGWAGDGWRLWDVDGRTLLSWRSEWDTAALAAKFQGDLVRRFLERHGPARARDGWLTFASRPPGRWFAVRREKDAVELVTADEPGLFEGRLRPQARGGDAPREGGGREPGSVSLDFGARQARVPDAGSRARKPAK